MPDRPDPAGETPLVSVAMITFNHARYIVQAVESVFAQKTNFPIELVVGDDCSTDETPSLLRELAQRFGPRMRLLNRPSNMGMTRNFFDVMTQCRGKYIALLEGDDYWTDVEKLARQVALMETHPDVALCHHNVAILDEATDQSRPFHGRPLRGITSGRTLLKGNIPATCSVLYRRQFDAYPEWLHRCHLGDWPSHLLHALGGNLRYIDRTMGVYRVHAGGIWSQQPQRRDLEKRVATTRVVAESLPEEFRGELEKTIERLVNDSAECLVKEGQAREAVEFVRGEKIPAEGLQRLQHFYKGLALEQSGQRLKALVQFLRAASRGRGATRIKLGDVLIAASRTAFPRLYGGIRKLRRRDAGVSQ